MTEGTSGQAATTPDDLAPGGSRAKARGCLCSVLANAAYRAGAPEEPFVDPRCPLHAAAPDGAV